MSEDPDGIRIVLVEAHVSQVNDHQRSPAYPVVGEVDDLRFDRANHHADLRPCGAVADVGVERPAHGLAKADLALDRLHDPPARAVPTLQRQEQNGLVCAGTSMT
jgi:hypothetical protein